MEQTITFKLEDFEGPLDLLLYLVSKNKMNIYDIEIVALIDQYVSMVNGLPVYQMESASEFIEMAARLVQMKSYFLLPKSEEAERMKEELTGMLVEYSACKEVAAQLRSMGFVQHAGLQAARCFCGGVAAGGRAAGFFCAEDTHGFGLDLLRQALRFTLL